MICLFTGFLSYSLQVGTYVSNQKTCQVQASLTTSVHRNQNLQYALDLRYWLLPMVSEKLYVLSVGYLGSIIRGPHAKLN